MATVSIVRCATYDRERVRAAVAEALRLLPELRDVRGGTVLLKPNLLSANDPPERAVNTHPEFVRAVGEFFRERGVGRLILGDSCGSLAPGATSRAIAMTGLDRVAEDLGAELFDADRAPSEEVAIPDGRILKSVRLPKLLREIDLLVTLPKMKTHGLTLITGAVKNQLGLVPGRGKKDTHLAAPSPAAMAQALLDIHSIVRPGLAVMDGVLAMEGNGPAAGRPREAGLALAADDCLAMDVVMARLTGFDPEEVDGIRFGRERGLGVGDPGQIRLRGVPLAEAAMPDFAKPPAIVRRAMRTLIPDRLWRWAFGVAGNAYAVVMDDRCVRCGECVANCPAKAISARDGRIVVDPALCIACYCCSEVCKARAIRFQRPLAGRMLLALRRLRRGAWRTDE
jgi:uncharacterized protein (DUF362 family)/Pyruvate/2-oxoacid:ferredoxin oxidoreductase delta subunit